MKKVTVYSTPTCTYCLMVKDYLKEKNVQFEEIDVMTSQEKQEELLKLTDGQMGVPVITVDEEVIFGFDKNRLEKALEL